MEENLDYQPEQLINDNEAIPIDILKKCLEKTTAICKILTGKGTGFFCKLNLKNKSIIALLTNNHVLNEEKIKLGSKIEIEHNKEKKVIEITKKRFTCTNEEYDYTCIEIFKDDNFNNYFEIDGNINTDNPNKRYKDQGIMMVQYPNLEEASFDKGKINSIENNYQIFHSISTKGGSSGSPIILISDTLKIIGIHCGKFKKDKNQNIGIYMKVILEDIQQHFSKFYKWELR
jgi:V8-like Glu-specific endopeptidase